MAYEKKQLTDEQKLESAMSRLNVHKGNLVCGRRAHYGGNICDDIKIVLEELFRLQQLESSMSPAR